MWRILLGRLPTEDSLVKAGMSLASSCRFCYASTETLAHLFLHCPYSHILYDYFSSLFRVHLNFQLSPLEFFISAISWKASPQVRPRPRPSRAPRIIEVYWHLPPPGWIKVNTDGASLGSPGSSSCGGVFCNHRGFVNCCFASLVGIMHAFEVELSAVIKAIEYAFDFGWHNLWIGCYSSYMVSILSCSSLNVPWRFLSS
ncbi:hypothetical protein Dsin_004672 [Dipteronia sinensis]|uniref:Uncharacterized protein n=1 Tax=Dipteronia sinensis TaxID=43782 RepID=A0AAE0AVW1_9ROSI|nr:hypothetical protein Dsin_004672 [Dipteronia sinensis]